MHGSRGEGMGLRTLFKPPHPRGNHKSVSFLLQKASIPCLAIIGPPAKRQLNSGPPCLLRIGMNLRKDKNRCQKRMTDQEGARSNPPPPLPATVLKYPNYIIFMGISEKNEIKSAKRAPPEIQDPPQCCLLAQENGIA